MPMEWMNDQHLNWYTYVTRQGTNYELNEDDTSVETYRSSLIICKLIVHSMAN
jgi:hypothetical protein